MPHTSIRARSELSMLYLIVVYTGEMKKCEVSTLQCNLTGAASWEVLGSKSHSCTVH